MLGLHLDPRDMPGETLGDRPLWVVFGLWGRLLDFRPGDLICSSEQPGSARTGRRSFLAVVLLTNSVIKRSDCVLKPAMNRSLKFLFLQHR
jgi:hypothetical protein